MISFVLFLQDIDVSESHVTIISMSLTRQDYSFFFFNDPAPPEIYTLSLHAALPISASPFLDHAGCRAWREFRSRRGRVNPQKLRVSEGPRRRWPRRQRRRGPSETRSFWGLTRPRREIGRAHV